MSEHSNSCGHAYEKVGGGYKCNNQWCNDLISDDHYRAIEKIAALQAENSILTAQLQDRDADIVQLRNKFVGYSACMLKVASLSALLSNSEAEIAALKAQLAASGWQDIKDAPRDKLILLCRKRTRASNYGVGYFSDILNHFTRDGANAFGATHFKLITPPR